MYNIIREKVMHYGLGSAKFIDRLYRHDEATLMIVYGGFLGTGKSSYCIKTMAEVYGSHSGWPDNKPDYTKVNDYLVFPPKEFVDLVLHVKRRQKCVTWDDMGLWMFALDWYDPFVKAVVKYFNVARTDWAMIIGNTPSPKMIVRRLHMFPESVRVKVVKEGGIGHKEKPRIATSYKVWSSPDLKKTGVTRNGMWQDRYSAMLPNDYFEKYEPKRKEYATLAKQLMLEELAKLHKVDREEKVEEGFKAVIPEPARVKELEELALQRL